MSTEKRLFNLEIPNTEERIEKKRIIADLKKGTEEYDKADEFIEELSEAPTEKSFPAVTEAGLAEHEENKRFTEQFNEKTKIDTNNLSLEEKIALFENQINELNKRNDELKKSIDRKKATASKLSKEEILFGALQKNQQKIAELSGKIAELEQEQDIEKAEQAIYNQEKPSFIKDEIISLAKGAGLNESQLEALLADNFTNNLLKKGYNPGDWENSQAILESELKTRQELELAIFNYEFPGIKLDTNGEPQLGFFSKLSGKGNKIKASRSYQNYRAFVNLTNHILESTPPVTRTKSNSKMRSIGKVVLAATAATAIGGPVEKKTAELTHEVDAPTNEVFSKNTSTDTKTVITAQEKSTAKFPEVTIAPVYDISSQVEETETRASRRSKNSFTEEDTGEVINFTEGEGLEIVDTTASKQRAELHKKQAIETAFNKPATTIKTTESTGPAKPIVNQKPIGSVANVKTAKAVVTEMFGDKLDQIIKKPLVEKKIESTNNKKTTTPNAFGSPDKFGKVEERIKLPSLSIASRPDTSNLRNKNNDKIVEGLHQAAREQAEIISKRINNTEPSFKNPTPVQQRDQKAELTQEVEEESEEFEQVTKKPGREMYSFKNSLPETELPKFSVNLDTQKTDRSVVRPDSTKKTRAELLTAGKEAGLKIKESISMREALRTALGASDLDQVLQDTYFNDATKKFDKLASKPAERTKFVNEIVQAAKVGPDTLIKFLNQ